MRKVNDDSSSVPEDSALELGFDESASGERGVLEKLGGIGIGRHAELGIGPGKTLDRPRILGIEMEGGVLRRLARDGVLDARSRIEGALQVEPARPVEGRHRRLGQPPLRLPPSVEVSEKAGWRAVGTSLHEEERRIPFDERRSTVARDRLTHDPISLARRRALAASYQIERLILQGSAGQGRNPGDDNERGAHPPSSEGNYSAEEAGRLYHL